MRKLITTMALLALIDTSGAIAQTVGLGNPRTRTVDCCRHRSATANRGSIKCPRKTTWVIRTIQSIARTRRLTAWSKAFAAVAKY
jgi:hypothetical protein